MAQDGHSPSSVTRWLLGAALVVAVGASGVVAAAVVASGILNRKTETVTVTVRYDDLAAGRPAVVDSTAGYSWDYAHLIDALDPANEAFPQLVPLQGRRLVAFRLQILINSNEVTHVTPSEFRLRDSDGTWHEPTLAFVGGSELVTTVLFELEDYVRADQLSYLPSSGNRLVFQFE